MNAQGMQSENMDSTNQSCLEAALLSEKWTGGFLIEGERIKENNNSISFCCPKKGYSFKK